MPVFFKKITPVSFYVFIALAMEIFLSWTSPPLQVPDEFNHFYRAYQISEGCFLPQQRDKRLGGDIPYDLSDFAVPFKMKSTVPQFKPPYNGKFDPFPNAVSEERCFRDFPNTAYYSPVSYLPQAFILFVLKIFHASPAVLYHAGRICSFLLSLLLMAWAIRLVPVHQWLFTLLVLLPMNTWLVNSFSADTMTNSLSFLLIALFLRAAFSQKALSNRLLVLICVVAGLLALAKMVYGALILLVFIIPAQKFANGKQQKLFVASLFGITLCITLLWYGAVMKHFLPYQQYNPAYRDAATLSGLSNYEAQKAYILAHPAYFPEVIFNSIFNKDQVYLSSYIGRFGAFLDVPLPTWLLFLAYAVILLIAVGEKKEVSFSLRQKLILMLAVLASLCLLLLSQHLTWDPVASGRVELLQGRYLIPLFPLLFIVFGAFFKNGFFTVRAVTIVFTLILNGFAVYTLYERYVYEPFNSVTRFTCDAETMDASGNYLTSSPQVLLQGCANQSSTEKRNGNFSALVSDKCPYCFTYVFKGFKKGDILDVSLWKKGEATLCMSGGKKECSKFYNEFDEVYYTDRKGWVNLHGILQITNTCDTVDIGFFVHNKNNASAYIDDLSFTIKKTEMQK